MTTPRTGTRPSAKTRSTRATRAVTATRGRREAIHDTLVAPAVQNALAVNPLVGLRRKDVLGAATKLLGQLARKPHIVPAQYVKLLGEYARIAAGRSTLAPSSGDRRFADPAWNENGLFRRSLQSYVALGRALDRCVDDVGLDAAGKERARFAVSLYVDALAPTNFLASNPAALRKLVDTKGVSAVRGLANLADDLANRRGLPRQVDARPFAIGRNLATTPGAVVFRNEVLELIQYTPATPKVHARPLLIVPPQINKYYVFDLTPDKSLVRWSLDSGVQTFAVSWRNPTKKQAHWGFDAYAEALEQAIDAMCDVAGSKDVNVLGACSGGITLSALLGNLAARRERKVHSATLAVCVLDTASMQGSTPGLFVSRATIAGARSASAKRGVVEGTDLARMFAWMRPNELVWNYVVNNYLLGNEPPAHDILFWNSDTTRLPARLHADFLELFESNAFAHPGKLRVRGRTIDVGRIGIDTYVVGGLTDHITTWQGVYRTAQLYGRGRTTFVLSNGGHIQSLINPPSNARSWFMTGTARARTPEAWLKRRQKVEGSWWPDWRNWIRARSGPQRPCPTSLGNARHPPLASAPGTYVHER